MVCAVQQSTGRWWYAWYWRIGTSSGKNVVFYADHPEHITDGSDSDDRGERLDVQLTHPETPTCGPLLDVRGPGQS